MDQKTVNEILEYLTLLRKVIILVESDFPKLVCKCISKLFRCFHRERNLPFRL